MHITFKQLEIFLAIAKTSNMSIAAEEIGLTQSACSISLSILENQLGGVLFDRSGKKLQLNDRGRLLLPMATNCIHQALEMQDKMIQGDIPMGHLNVGASTTIGNYVLPKIVAKFCGAFKDAKVSLQIANTKKIVADILSFSADIGFIEGNCYVDEIEVIPWKKDQLVVFTYPAHPLVKKAKITMKDLRDSQWVMRESGSGTREKFEEAMGGDVEPFLELGDSQAIKQMVMGGLGLSCLSREIIAPELKNGSLIELAAPLRKLERDFYILLHKQKYKTYLLKAFLSAVK